MARALTRIKEIPSSTASQLKANGIATCEDLISRNCLEVMNFTGLSLTQLQSFVSAVCRTTAPKPQSVLSMYVERNKPLATSLHKLDSDLHGGLQPGSVTEVVGPAGCGKTQFCIMLSAIVAMPAELGGRDMKVAYIDTEATFSPERFLEIVNSRSRNHFSSPNDLQHLASKIEVFQDMTLEAFTRRLDQCLEEVLAEGEVGLLVVDSLASPFRKEFETHTGTGLAHRTTELSRMAAVLKFLAETYAIPVVVTNQITTHVSRGHDDSTEKGGVVTAALGNTWSHCVNTRLALQYHGEGQKRLLTIAKSPLCANENYVVTVEEKGLMLDWVATSTVHSGPGDLSELHLQTRTMCKTEAWPESYKNRT